MLPKFKDLTENQKKIICNGCGGKGNPIKVPNFLFKASCDHHDYKYWAGYTDIHFKVANKQFYKWMKVDIKEAHISWYKRSYYHIWAYSYYITVKFLGKKYFRFAKNPRTIEELNIN